MVEVLIKKLLYIKDIPVELLKKALSIGELNSGKTIGLEVQPEGEEKAFIELKHPRRTSDTSRA